MERSLIESIINTYELPIKIKNKIINVAQSNLKTNNYQEIYSYISFLVEKFYQTPYKERFFTRLDAPIKEGSNTQFYELIKTPNYTEDSQKDLKEKLEKLILGQEEPLIFLGRPIIQIEPVIKLGRRQYNKNPLSLFREHHEFYRGKSRTQVFHDDSGMYESLRRWNQLHIAIPEVIAPGSTTKISKKKEKEIIKTYQTLKSPTKIAKKLRITRATVDYYLEKHKLRTLNKKTGNPGYSKQMIENIVECLNECKNASKVAKLFGVSRWAVIKYGRNSGVPILSRGGNIKNLLKNKKHTPKTF